MKRISLFHLFIGSSLAILLTHPSAEDDIETSQSITGGERISLEVLVDRESVPANEVLRLTIRLSWPGELDRYKILRPEEPSCEGLVIVGSSTANERSRAGGQTVAHREFVYLLKPTRVGRGKISPITLSYRDVVMEKEFTLSSEEIGVEITPAQDVRKWDVRRLFPWMGGVALLLLTVLAVRYFIGKRGAATKVEEIQGESPEDVALRELQEAKGARLSGDKEYCSAMASVLRRYLASKYEIRTMEVTTYDLIGNLRMKKVDEEIVKQIEDILSTCDLVKFAQHEPESLHRLDARIREFLENQKGQVENTE